MTAETAEGNPGPPPVPIHAAANVFHYDPGDFDGLVADIREHGLREPIVRNSSGAILDGRRRYHACIAAGVKPTYRVYVAEPFRFVLKANAHRLDHLNQRAMVAVRAALHPASRLGFRDVQALCGVSMGSLQRARTAIRSGIPALVARTEAGDVPLSTAARLAGEPPEEQERFLRQIDLGFAARSIGSRLEQRRRNPYAPPPERPLTQRVARYRYVQESALQLVANCFDSLAIVMNTAHGLDPNISSEQAAQWRADLSRRAKSYRALLALLNARSLSNDDTADHGA